MDQLKLVEDQTTAATDALGREDLAGADRHRRLRGKSRLVVIGIEVRVAAAQEGDFVENTR